MRAPGRITADVPFLEFRRWPELSRVGVNGEYQEREEFIRGQTARVISRRKFIEGVKRWHEEAGLPEERTSVVVTFRLDGDRVHALVEWRGWRVGSNRVLRRLSGDLPVSGRHLRGIGPVVALHRLLRALGEVTDL